MDEQVKNIKNFLIEYNSDLNKYKETQDKVIELEKITNEATDEWAKFYDIFDVIADVLEFSKFWKSDRKYRVSEANALYSEITASEAKLKEAESCLNRKHMKLDDKKREYANTIIVGEIPENYDLENIVLPDGRETLEVHEFKSDPTRFFEEERKTIDYLAQQNMIGITNVSTSSSYKLFSGQLNHPARLPIRIYEGTPVRLKN